MPEATQNRLNQRFASPRTWPHGAAEAWASARAPTSLFSAPNRSASWRETTKFGVEQAYRRWLRWYITRDTFPAEVGFAERVTPEELEEYVGALRLTIADSTIATSLAFLKMALFAMAPNHPWAWMEVAIGTVKRGARPVRQKRQRLVPVHDLVALGYDLMERSECRAGTTPTLEQALDFRNGLMIVLLAVRPFRKSNFSEIIIGRSLVSRDGAYWLTFKGAETKNGEELDQIVPEFLQEPLQFYLDDVRPVLAARPRGQASEGNLWLNSLGSPMSNYGVYRTITALTNARFGHPINPHLFRDCLATTMANEDPDHVQLIKFSLGHLNSAIADKYYIHAQGNVALTRVQQHVLARRAAKHSDG